jgi:anti-sigma B factor antagonist
MAFNLTSETVNGISRITLIGELDAASAGYFRDSIELVATSAPRRLVLITDGLTYMASAGLRALVFAKQKMGASVDIYLIGVQEPVRETLEMTGFLHSVILLETYDAAEIENI